MTTEELKIAREQVDALERELFEELKGKAALLGLALVPLDSIPDAPKAKYTDGNGNAWTGRGRKPQWVLDMEAQGRTLESLQARHD